MRRYVRGDSVQRVCGDGTDSMVDEAERRDAKIEADTHEAADVCGIALAIENAPKQKRDDNLRKSLAGYSKGKSRASGKSKPSAAATASAPPKRARHSAGRGRREARKR